MKHHRWGQVSLRQETRLAICFFGMLVVGAVYANLCMVGQAQIEERLLVHTRITESLLQQDGAHLFVYILPYRLLQLATALLVVRVAGLRFLLDCVALCMGGLYGVLMAVESASLGTVGIIYGIVVWCPQIVGYGAGYWILCRMARGICLSRRQLCVEGGCIIVCLLAGCLLEAFVNPGWMAACHQYLVPVFS